MLGGQRTVVNYRTGLVLDRAICVPSVISSGGAVDLEFEFRASQAGAIQQAAILLHTSAGARIGIVDIRESEALPFRHTAGRFAIKRVIKLFLLSTYTVGLYVVTDDSRRAARACAILGLRRREHSGYIPYPAEHRGVISLHAKCEFESAKEALTLP